MLRRSDSTGFWASVLFTMALNLQWLFPAVVLLVLHFVFGLSLWWTAAAVGLWILWILVAVALLCLASKAGNAPRPQTENKNPYSKKTEDMFR